MFSNTQLVTLTDINFKSEVLNSQKLILVDCWASWCGAFHQVNPAYHELAIAHSKHIKIGRLNIALFDQLGTYYGIRVVPTLLIFQNGQVIDRSIGNLSNADLARKLSALLSATSVSGISVSKTRVAYL